MKKVHINEESMKSVRKNKVLPDFLFRMLKTHTTSLGDNEAFPSGDDYDFDYTVIKKRFSDVSDEIKDVGVESTDPDYLVSELSSLVKECMEREKPMRNTLERMCENLVNRLFAIPMDIVNMSFKLTEKITYNKSPRIQPEPSKSTGVKFRDTEDMENSRKSVAKRRFINSLIQGGAYHLMLQLLEDEELNGICNDMMPLYRKVIAINDYLLFTRKDKITDERPMQGSYVEVHLGSDVERCSIDAQGLIFPLLLQESIRGLLELFSSHGLPKDADKAKYIIKRADFLMAEPWDMRFGPELWEMIFGGVRDTNILPYLFMRFVKLPVEEFNRSSKEILAGTESGERILADMISDATHEYEYRGFENRVNARNVSKAIVTDGYFTASEISGLELDGGEDEDGDVIEEDSAESVQWRGKGYNYWNKDTVCSAFFIMNDGSTICGPFTSNQTHEEVMLLHCYKILGKNPPIRETDGSLIYNEAYDEIERGNSRLFNNMCDNIKRQGRVFKTDDGCYVFSCYEPLEDSDAKEMMAKVAFKLGLDRSKCYYSGHYGTKVMPLTEQSNTVRTEDFTALLENAGVGDIDFVEGGVGWYDEEVILSVNGTKIPTELVHLDFRVVNKRFPSGTKRLLNMDIALDPSLRGHGLGTKIYAKAVMEFGAICSRHSTRHNDDGIRGIFGKLGSIGGISVFQDTYENMENETICDYYAILDSVLNEYV
jgi:hypothetical protein